MLISSGMLLACLLCSCEVEVFQSEDNLCNGYWYQPSDRSAPMMQFDSDGEVIYLTWRYEAAEEMFYVRHDDDMDGRYIMDVENSTLCLLPDQWYDIYILSERIMTLSDGHGRTVEMANIPEDMVTVLSDREFRRKYPDAE